LIVVKDGNTDIVVELEPVKGKPGEYVNYQNKKEVYTKTADGKFERKTTSSSPQASPSVELSSPTDSPDVGSDYTAATPTFRADREEFIKLFEKAKLSGAKTYSKEAMNAILSAKGNSRRANVRGYINASGDLIYHRFGGKLNRLNNYLNNK
jgi:hypothetical protein